MPEHCLILEHVTKENVASVDDQITHITELGGPDKSMIFEKEIYKVHVSVVVMSMHHALN